MMGLLLHAAAINGVISRCWPSVCLVCRKKSSSCYDLCEVCEDQLSTNSLACPVCALPQSINAACDCDRLAEYIDASFVPFLYQGIIPDLIQRFKYRYQRQYGRLLSSLMIESLMKSDIVDWPQVLVPVPTHWRRRFRRGFNPSEDLAHDLSRHFSIPVATKIVGKYHGQQLSKIGSRGQRIAAAEASFYIKPRRLDTSISHIAIVDDVMTTGATACHLAAVLKDSGVNRVQVWACARTVIDKDK